MASEYELSRGWTLEEAVQNTVDPEILALRDEAVNAWRAAGAPQRPSLLLGRPDDPEVRQSRVRYDEVNCLYGAISQANGRRVQELRRHLFGCRLIAWGRRESPLAPGSLIPPSAWKVLPLHDLDLGASMVRARDTARVLLYDVRVYPVVDAPEAVDHLANRSFVEACRMSVFEDPQLLAMRKRAGAAGGEPAAFGYTAEPERMVWPVDYGMPSAWKQPTAGAIEEPKITHTRAADQILETRFSRLMKHLRSGMLVAEGVPPQGGAMVEIPRSLWARQRAYVDLENGDLWDGSPAPRSVYDFMAEEQEVQPRLRKNDPAIDLSRPIFMGLMLRKPTAALIQPAASTPQAVMSAPTEMFHGKPIGSDEPPSSTTEPARASDKPAIVRVETTAAAYQACVAWLASLMRASKDRRTESREALWKMAQSKWPGILSERSFLDARKEAIRETGANAWAASGAPKRNRRSNRRAE